MIEGHEKFRMQDLAKKNDLYIEVNWDNKEENSQCKILRVTLLNGETAFISRDNMMAMLFAIGQPHEQRDMIPYKIRSTKWYETIISVKARKKIEKGESITFPLKITLPSVEEEIAGKWAKKSSSIITPKNI